jgi:acetyltransferase-like isoleucine patch superfamily enzyme
MRRFRDLTPPEVMRLVTTELIGRAIHFSRKTGRTIRISKTARGERVDVRSLDSRNAEGRQALESFLTPIKRQYTISGLGSPEERDSVNWRKLNLPLGRRWLLAVQLVLSMVMRGTAAKNKLYRWMGAHVGHGTEIMQTVWLDHFRPELIFIGDNTLAGAFSRITVHGYEGSGKFRYGLVEIGSNCTLGAGTGIGPVRIGDGVRTFPGTTVSPYFARIPDGAVVGGERPPIQRAENAGE